MMCDGISSAIGVSIVDASPSDKFVSDCFTNVWPLIFGLSGRDAIACSENKEHG